MKEIMDFDFKGQGVRVIVDDIGCPWWVAIDVCRILNIKNSRDALKSLDDDERSTVALTDGTSPKGGNPNINIINEPGLYTLILRSRKPAAKKFKRWVTHEILPALRKTGRYEFFDSPGARDSVTAYQAKLKPYQRIRLLEMAHRMASSDPASISLVWKTYGELCRVVGGPHFSKGGLHEFIEARCLKGGEFRTPKKELYRAYEKFCEAQGFKPTPYNGFFRDIKAMEGFYPAKMSSNGSRVHAVRGLGLADGDVFH